jgi:hypothetical protein
MDTSQPIPQWRTRRRSPTSRRVSTWCGNPGEHQPAGWVPTSPDASNGAGSNYSAGPFAGGTSGRDNGSGGRGDGSRFSGARGAVYSSPEPRTASIARRTPLSVDTDQSCCGRRGRAQHTGRASAAGAGPAAGEPAPRGSYLSCILELRYVLVFRNRTSRICLFAAWRFTASACP